MGRGTKIKTGIFLSVTLITFVIAVIMAALAGGGGAPKLFPTPMKNVSDNFQLLITPVGATFSIWGVIFFLQFLWMVYALVCLCRSGSATNLLSGKFYLAFTISTAFIIGWLFAFSRQDVIASMIVLIMQNVFLEVAFGFACTDLRSYLQTRDVDRENKGDVWAQRILVQNGILFFLTWTNVASLLNIGIFLNRELEASDQTSSLFCLSILVVITILWFIMENFVVNTYTEYTFTYYIAQTWALIGVLSGVWGENDSVAGLTLALLILTVLLFIARIVIVALRVRKRESYETISYHADSENVKTG